MLFRDLDTRNSASRDTDQYDMTIIKTFNRKYNFVQIMYTIRGGVTKTAGLLWGQIQKHSHQQVKI